MASKGRLSDWSGQLDCKFLVHSTCKTTKAGIGGPLVDFSGRFIGMNFYEKNIGTPSLLCNHIIIVLQSFKKKGSGKISSSVPFWTMDMDKDETVPPNRWPVPKPYWCHRDNLPEDISVFAPNGRML
ncbi:uncharacterized protein LOC8074118 [Sorghum bicolor]|uniref:uncharacterized protein LOC8074118 n=1 Tax=Sorghum bicolor TaxID=4558 RepID=UPI00081AC23D|nr:uncharacterized protein LOC8074118 [Sorghum bicolor]|eukprot:XP_002459159.2 uncharacterized protein LOC8074118 [Sorghum bicolor]